MLPSKIQKKKKVSKLSWLGFFKKLMCCQIDRCQESKMLKKVEVEDKVDFEFRL